ncbi:MAG: SpoVA/SpoVAEb family sporulation membrane protein [Ruminococcaceae bacterium]|nr:SpoVA/SpoVAEb family sporulation membrane protein [Oscillospiraceae bacterium]
MFVPYLTLAEGFVTGVGAKMFIIAGPVIVYGVMSSAIYGVIYYFLGGGMA